MVKYAAVTLILCVAVFLLRPLGKPYAMAVGTVGLVVLILGALSILGSTLESFQSIISVQEGQESPFQLVFSLTGTALITQSACSICRQTGEEELAKACSFVGRTVLIAMTLPVLWEYLDWLRSLLSSF